MKRRFICPLAVKVVIIDLDGTLIDTAADITAATNAMLEELGMKAYDRATIADWIGDGVGSLVKRALTGHLTGEPDRELYDRAYRLLLERYRLRLADESRPYPGVTQALSHLQASGFMLACITNKPEALTMPLLRELHLDGYFRLILSGDALPRRKPDPLPLLHACEYFSVPPEQAVLVGDSANDTMAAKAAGMPVICVTYGYNRGIDVRALEPEAVIDSLTELPRYIRLLEG
jgi:phosphoglycolate phosphatase